MNEKSEPTHILHIEIPLKFVEPTLPFRPDVIQDAIQACLYISRIAYEGYICDDPQVNLETVKEAS